MLGLELGSELGLELGLHLICFRVKTRVRASVCVRCRALFSARLMAMDRVRAGFMWWLELALGLGLCLGPG